MTTYPKISVVTPSYNQGAFLEKTINSVISQNYPNLEFIIIDGGSQDNSIDIIKKYENHFTYWVSESDRGQSHALNKGFNLATGDILTWLNSDDRFMNQTLWRFAELFQDNPDAGVVVGAGRIVNQKGEEIYFKEPQTEITIESLFTWLNNGNFMQPSSAFSKSVWSLTGGLDENVHIALDLDFWLRIAAAGVRFVTCSELLSEALSHPQAKTTAYENLMRLECAIIIIRHGGESEVRNILENMVTKYTWYQENYEAIINNPIIKFLQPIIKILARDERGYWKDQVPPWVNKF